MDTDVIYALHVETYSHKEKISKILGVKRIDKRDYDEMENVKREYLKEFNEYMDNAHKNNMNLMEIDTTTFNIKEIKKYYITYDPKDL